MGLRIEYDYLIGVVLIYCYTKMVVGEDDATLDVTIAWELDTEGFPDN